MEEGSQTEYKDWGKIEAFVGKWFDDTAGKLDGVNVPAGADDEFRAFWTLAKIQVVKLRDYAALALDAFKKQWYMPGLALLRVVYESAIWIQWVVDQGGHALERIEVWRKYTLNEQRKYFEELSDVSPQAKECLERCEDFIASVFQHVDKRGFYDIFTGLFGSMKKQVEDHEDKSRKVDEMRHRGYACYRELCYYAHAHPSIEEHFRRNTGIVARSEMPVRAPFFAAFAVVHLLHPIRRYHHWDMKEMMEEFSAFGW